MGRATRVVALLGCLAAGCLGEVWNCGENAGGLSEITSAGKALMFVPYVQKDSKLCVVDVRKFGSSGGAEEVCTNGPFGKYPRGFYGHLNKAGTHGLAFWEELDYSTTLYSVDVAELTPGSSRGIKRVGPIITGGTLSDDQKTMVSVIQSSEPAKQGIVVTHLPKLGTPEATSVWLTPDYYIISLTGDNSIGVSPYGGNGSSRHVEGDQACLVYINTIRNGTDPKIACTPKLPPSMHPYYPKISPNGKMVGWWVHETGHACFMTTKALLAGEFPSCLKGPEAERWVTGVSYLTDKYAVLRGNCAVDLEEFIKNNETTTFGCAEEIENPKNYPISPGGTSEDGSVTWSRVYQGHTISSTIAYVCRSTLADMAANKQSNTVCKNLKKYLNSQYYHGIAPLSPTEAIVTIQSTICYWKL